MGNRCSGTVKVIKVVLEVRTLPGLPYRSVENTGRTAWEFIGSNGPKGPAD